MLSPSPIDWFFLFEEAWNMGHSKRLKYRPKKLTFSFQVPTLEIKMSSQVPDRFPKELPIAPDFYPFGKCCHPF
jgi:hypothetical protein